MRDGTTAAIVVVALVFIAGLVVVIGALRDDADVRKAILASANNSQPCYFVPNTEPKKLGTDSPVSHWT